MFHPYLKMCYANNIDIYINEIFGQNRIKGKYKVKTHNELLTKIQKCKPTVNDPFYKKTNLKRTLL